MVKMEITNEHGIFKLGDSGWKLLGQLQMSRLHKFFHVYVESRCVIVDLSIAPAVQRWATIDGFGDLTLKDYLIKTGAINYEQL